jgi:hypothetical protein
MINTSSWRPFALKYLFDFMRGKGITTAEISENIGNIPCIQSGELNNGIIGYMNEAFIYDNRHTYVLAPFLTVARSGASGCINVQNKNSYIGDSVYALKLKDTNSIYIYFFISTLLNKERYRYSYGHKVSIETYIKQHIKLPQANSGKPDWKYMENYAKKMYDKIVPKSTTRIKQSDPTALDVKRKWNTFFLTDIFNVRMGNKFDLIDMSFNNPSVNFVNRSGQDNGVSKKVDLISNVVPFSKGNISLALGGSICSAFLQVKPFYTGQNVAVLTARYPLSVFQKLFLCTMIYNEKIKYSSFGRELNVHLKTFSMPLPVDDMGNPDWQYMENYIKALPYSDKI